MSTAEEKRARVESRLAAIATRREEIAAELGDPNSRSPDGTLFGQMRAMRGEFPSERQRKVQQRIDGLCREDLQLEREADSLRGQLAEYIE